MNHRNLYTSIISEIAINWIKFHFMFYIYNILISSEISSTCLLKTRSLLVKVNQILKPLNLSLLPLAEKTHQ